MVFCFLPVEKTAYVVFRMPVLKNHLFYVGQNDNTSSKGFSLGSLLLNVSRKFSRSAANTKQLLPAASSSVACRWRLEEPIQQACQSPIIKDALNQDTSTPFSSAQAFTITAWRATGKQMSLQSRHLCCWWQAVGRKAYCVPTANELSDSLHHSQGLPV